MYYYGIIYILYIHYAILSFRISSHFRLCPSGRRLEELGRFYTYVEFYNTYITSINMLYIYRNSQESTGLCSGFSRWQCTAEGAPSKPRAGTQSAKGLEMTQPVILATVLPLTSYVAFGQSPYLFVPQSPHWKI